MNKKLIIIGIALILISISLSGCLEADTDKDANSNMKGSVRSRVDSSNMGPPEFESESLAPKAKRMDQATPRARFLVR